MKNYVSRHLIVAIQLLLIIGAIVLATIIVHVHEQKMVTELTENLKTQHVYISELAKLTDQNAADEVINAIVPDCSRRTEYESLLVKLGSLTKKDLVVVQNLHENCGTFYTMQKALMVTKLEREITGYTETLKLLGMLNAQGTFMGTEKKWNELLAFEKTRSALLGEQTEIQKQIISALISGASPQSDEVGELLRTAQEINELLGVENQKIDSLRDEITL